MSEIQKLAEKFSKKYAQQQPLAPVVPAAGNQNYVKLMEAYARLMVNVASGLGEDAVGKISPIVVPYKASAGQTSTENAKVVAQGLKQNLAEIQKNLNEVNQYLNAVLA